MKTISCSHSPEYKVQLNPKQTSLMFSVCLVFSILYYSTNPFSVSTHTLGINTILDTSKKKKKKNVELHSLSHQLECMPNFILKTK